MPGFQDVAQYRRSDVVREICNDLECRGIGSRAWCSDQFAWIKLQNVAVNNLDTWGCGEIVAQSCSQVSIDFDGDYAGGAARQHPR